LDVSAALPCYGLVITAPDQKPTLKYRADIDGMRAVAILLVLVFHFSLMPFGGAGFIGVDLFFVISGFLITAILDKQLASGTFSLKSFYIGRVRRLAPALFTTLVLVTAAGSVWLFPREFANLADQVVASQLYVSNIYYWLHVNYFGLGADDVYLLHTWSLGVEEQFYLLYPLCLLLLYAYVPQGLRRPALLAALIASFGLNILFMTVKPEATFYLLPTRAWELLIGGLIALRPRSTVRGRLTREILGMAGVALLLSAIVFYRPDIRFPGYFALLPTGTTACWLLAGEGGGYVTSALSSRPLNYLGRISYSLYLVHWPINIFARHLMVDYDRGWRLAMFAVSIGLAAAIYHFIEEPVRRRQFLSSSAHLLRGYAVGVTATVLISGAILVSGGVPQRFPARVAKLASFVDDKSPPLSECEFVDHSPLRLGDLCRIGEVDRAPTWFVYGDSHAWAAHLAFDKWLRLRGEAGVFMFRNSCPPLVGIHLVGDHDRCFHFNESVVKIIRANPALASVALVSVWREAIEGRLSESPTSLGTTEESVQLFTRQFSRTVALLKTLDRSVYVWEPVPGSKESAPLGLARAALRHRVPDLEVDRSRYVAEYQFFFAALAANCSSITGSFSPSAALCATGKCAVEYLGIPLYADSAHITSSTADFWVDVLRHPLPCQPPPSAH
jgi:peptidoglycan/LPS O-acetylase OafA/YrhL